MKTKEMRFAIQPVLFKMAFEDRPLREAFRKDGLDGLLEEMLQQILSRTAGNPKVSGRMNVEGAIRGKKLITKHRRKLDRFLKSDPLASLVTADHLKTLLPGVRVVSPGPTILAALEAPHWLAVTVAKHDALKLRNGGALPPDMQSFAAMCVLLGLALAELHGLTDRPLPKKPMSPVFAWAAAAYAKLSTRSKSTPTAGEIWSEMKRQKLGDAKFVDKKRSSYIKWSVARHGGKGWMRFRSFEGRVSEWKPHWKK